MIDLNDIKVGDIVRHRTGNAFIVIRTFPDIIAIRWIQISNPHEWDKIVKRKNGEVS